MITFPIIRVFFYWYRFVPLINRGLFFYQLFLLIIIGICHSLKIKHFFSNYFGFLIYFLCYILF